jgi:hypothetical protein
MAGKLTQNTEMGKDKLTKRGNQLPVFVARWPHGSRVCFATFSWWKITNIAKNSTTAKYREKISTDMESFFNARLTKFKHNQVLLNKVKP